ncbi:MAG: glycosyl transferase, partial [Bryobacteraceae bacterium]
MADFCQTGDVATLHRFGSHDWFRINSELEGFSRDASIGLVLPALYSEFEKPAMRRIANELRRVRFLRHIVVALGKATYEEYQHAQSFFDGFSTPVTMLWIDSEPVQNFLNVLEQQGITAGTDGKGRSCWLSYGFLLASGNCNAIVLHDCDIKNYSSEMLARLCYPIAHPELDFEFCKGYYARITDRMHGRVTRLFMAPLIRAMEGLAPENGLLRFLESFRYPLAGEFAMKAKLARINRI